MLYGVCVYTKMFDLYRCIKLNNLILFKMTHFFICQVSYDPENYEYVIQQILQWWPNSRPINTLVRQGINEVLSSTDSTIDANEVLTSGDSEFANEVLSRDDLAFNSNIPVQNEDSPIVVFPEQFEHDQIPVVVSLISDPAQPPQPFETNQKIQTRKGKKRKSKMSHDEQVKRGKITFDKIKDMSPAELKIYHVSELRDMYAWLMTYVFYANEENVQRKWSKVPSKWNKDNRDKVPPFVQPYNKGSVEINEIEKSALLEMLKSCSIPEKMKCLLRKLRTKKGLSYKYKKSILDIAKNSNNFDKIKAMLCKNVNIVQGDKTQLIDAIRHCIEIKKRDNPEDSNGLFINNTHSNLFKNDSMVS